MLKLFVEVCMIVGTLLVALGVTANGQCPGGVCPAPARQFAAPPSFYQGQQFMEPTYYEPPSFGVPAPLAGVREFREPVMQAGSIPYVIFCPCCSQQAPAPAPTYYQQQSFASPVPWQGQPSYYGVPAPRPFLRRGHEVRVDVGVRRR